MIDSPWSVRSSSGSTSYNRAWFHRSSHKCNQLWTYPYCFFHKNLKRKKNNIKYSEDWLVHFKANQPLLEDIDTQLTKAWTAIDKLSIIWTSDLTDKMKRSFFHAAVVSILLYGCTTWTLTKRLEKKIDGYYPKMMRVILNKSWRQHLTKHQLYSHLPPITKTIQVRGTRHARHCWRNKDELTSDILLWTLAYGRAKAGRSAWTYTQQLCENTRWSPEDQSEAMNDEEKWRERVRDIRAGGTTWWWWSSFG